MGFVRSERPIHFGTSGWRGVLAEDFTFERAYAAVLGVARWLRESGVSRPVFVAARREPSPTVWQRMEVLDGKRIEFARIEVSPVA